MPQYLSERNIPGAGKLKSAELMAISLKSCSVLNQLGPQIQWEHARLGGVPLGGALRAPPPAAAPPS